jgi:hypothetical protein
MKTWQTLLREHDPAGDARLPSHDIEAIRRAAAAAARETRPAAVQWQRPLAMAAVVVLMVGSGVIAGRRAASRQPAVAPAAEPSPAQAGALEQRQLQFATPGGTRIIWVFNPEFDLKETTP